MTPAENEKVFAVERISLQIAEVFASAKLDEGQATAVLFDLAARLFANVDAEKRPALVASAKTMLDEMIALYASGEQLPRPV
jgi:hypothetical protein